MVKSAAGFGETVFLRADLKEINCDDFSTESVVNVDGRDYEIQFVATDYLLDNKMYDINENIFLGSNLDYIFSTNFLVEKHISTKQQLYGSGNMKIPQFFEMFHVRLREDLCNNYSSERLRICS